MIVLQKISYTNPSQCEYTKDNVATHKYFSAENVSQKELDNIFNKEFRRQGSIYYKPECTKCNLCQSAIIDINLFTLNKNHLKILNKNKTTKAIFNKPEYREEIYKIYEEWSLNRFNKVTNEDDFINLYYSSNDNTIQTEYYIDNELAAVGFVDLASNSISSNYFFYKDKFKKYSLGIYSILTEIQFAKSLGLSKLFLGYYVVGNKKTEYKKQFITNKIIITN